MWIKEALAKAGKPAQSDSLNTAEHWQAFLDKGDLNGLKSETGFTPIINLKTTNEKS